MSQVYSVLFSFIQFYSILSIYPFIHFFRSLLPGVAKILFNLSFIHCSMSQPIRSTPPARRNSSLSAIANINVAASKGKIPKLQVLSAQPAKCCTASQTHDVVDQASVDTTGATLRHFSAQTDSPWPSGGQVDSNMNIQNKLSCINGTTIATQTNMLSLCYTETAVQTDLSMDFKVCTDCKTFVGNLSNCSIKYEALCNKLENLNSIVSEIKKVMDDINFSKTGSNNDSLPLEKKTYVSALQNRNSSSQLGSINNELTRNLEHSSTNRKQQATNLFSSNRNHSTLEINSLQIRIDGMPENMPEISFFERSERDRKSVINILQYLDAECHVSNVHRIGKYLPSSKRRLVFEVHDLFIFKKILANVRKLKNYSVAGIYVNRNLQGEEAKTERTMLRQRWKLINIDKVPRESIKCRHGQIFVNGILHLDDSLGGNTNLRSNVANESISIPSDYNNSNTVFGGKAVSDNKGVNLLNNSNNDLKQDHTSGKFENGRVNS